MIKVPINKKVKTFQSDFYFYINTCLKTIFFKCLFYISITFFVENAPIDFNLGTYLVSKLRLRKKKLSLLEEIKFFHFL